MSDHFEEEPRKASWDWRWVAAAILALLVYQSLGSSTPEQQAAADSTYDSSASTYQPYYPSSGYTPYTYTPAPSPPMQKDLSGYGLGGDPPGGW